MNTLSFRRRVLELVGDRPVMVNMKCDATRPGTFLCTGRWSQDGMIERCSFTGVGTFFSDEEAWMNYQPPAESLPAHIVKLEAVATAAKALADVHPRSALGRALAALEATP